MDLIPFRPGDRVTLNAHGRSVYPHLRKTTGTYLHPARDTVRMVVQRDGLRKPEVWPSSYWELVPSDGMNGTEVLPMVLALKRETAPKKTVVFRLPASLIARVQAAAIEQERTVTAVIRGAIELALELSARAGAGERVVCEDPKTGERTRILLPPM